MRQFFLFPLVLLVGYIGTTLLEDTLGINYQGVSSAVELTHKSAIALWGVIGFMLFTKD